MNETERKKRVLVVDDQPKILRFVEIGLKLRGFEVITTTRCEEALEHIRSAEPDIMLLDIVMPGMDGFEMLRQLRAFSQLPVIAFSASAENRDGAMRLGANDFVLKPFDHNEMIRRIGALIL